MNKTAKYEFLLTERKHMDCPDPEGAVALYSTLEEAQVIGLADMLLRGLAHPDCAVVVNKFNEAGVPEAFGWMTLSGWEDYK